MPKRNTCLFCGKKAGIGERVKDKFCNINCYNNHFYKDNKEYRKSHILNSKKYYDKMKNNAEYKRKNKERLSRWLSIPKNRARFNELLRETNRIRMKRKLKERKKKNLCSYCGKVKAEKGFASCFSCRAIRRERDARLRERKKSS